MKTNYPNAIEMPADTETTARYLAKLNIHTALDYIIHQMRFGERAKLAASFGVSDLMGGYPEKLIKRIREWGASLEPTTSPASSVPAPAEEVACVPAPDSAPLTAERKDLTGTTFISPNHSNKVNWTVERYHRGGNWVCRESGYQTTMQFHESDILEFSQAITCGECHGEGVVRDDEGELQECPDCHAFPSPAESPLDGPEAIRPPVLP